MSSIFFPQEGENVIRILSPFGSGDDPFFEVNLHWYWEEGKLATTICARSRPRKSCVICTAIPDLGKQGKEGRKLAHGLKAKERVFTQIFDRKNPEGGAQIWNFSLRLSGEVLSIINDPKYGDITDLDEGFDLILTRSGEGKKTRYSLTVSQNSEKVDAAVLDDLIDLEQYCEPPDEETQQKILCKQREILRKQKKPLKRVGFFDEITGEIND